MCSDNYTSTKGWGSPILPNSGGILTIIRVALILMRISQLLGEIPDPLVTSENIPRGTF